MLQMLLEPPPLLWHQMTLLLLRQILMLMGRALSPTLALLLPPLLSLAPQAIELRSAKVKSDYDITLQCFRKLSTPQETIATRLLNLAPQQRVHAQD